MKNKVISLICCITVSMLLCSCGLIRGIGKNGLADVFDTWEEDNDANIAIFDRRKDIIRVDGKVISLSHVLGKNYENTHQEIIVCVRHNRIYGIHVYNAKQREYTADIYSIDITTNEFEILYTRKFDLDESVGTIKYLSYETVYYSNNAIVIYDGYHVISYRIDTNEVKELNQEDFSPPKKEYFVERIYDETGNINFKEIKVKNEAEERIVSVNYMSQRHQYVKELLEIGIIKNPIEEIDPLKYFFFDNFVINDNIYLICRVLDNDGESNALIFSYDFEKDTIKFIYHDFSNDIPSFAIIEVDNK